MAVTRISTQLVLDGTLTHLDFSTANRDGVDNTPSLRTLNDVAVDGTPVTSGQAAPADDRRINYSPHRHIHSGAGGIDPDQDGFDPHFFFPGVQFQQPSWTGVGVGSVVSNTVFMLPFQVMDFTDLNRVVIGNTNNGTSARFNFGIYEDYQADGVTHPGRGLWPRNLVTSFGSGINFTGAIPFESSLVNITVEPNRVYWAAWVFSATVVPSFQLVTAARLDPQVGWNRPTSVNGIPFNSAASGGAGYKFVGLGLTLPNPFPLPTGLFPGPTIPTTDSIPLLGLSYSF